MSKGIGKYYKISDDGETLKRIRKFCPRCGPGTFMAEMYDRIVCGHCGFTEFKKKPPKKDISEDEEFVEEPIPKEITKEPKPAPKKDAKPKKKSKKK